MTHGAGETGPAGGGEDRAPTEEAPRSKLLVILTLAMAMAPLSGYAAAALSPTLVADLGITSAQFGMFATVSFLSAAACSLALARMIGRLPEKAQLAIIFVATALTFALLAIADDLTWLLLAALVSGPAHALSNPFTNRVVAERIRGDQRTRWMGIKQSGVQCSQAFAGLVLPVTAAALGWRVSFVTLSVGGLALIVWGTAPFAARRVVDRGTAATVAVASLVPPFSRRLVWAFALYALCSGAGMQATNVYLPLFARDMLQMSPVAAGFTVAVAGAVGLCARILWGRASDLGSKAGSLLLRLALGAIGGVVCLAIAAETGSAPLLWIGVVLHGATAIGSNVVVMVGMMARVPTGQAGIASATVAMGMYLGFALGPLLISGLLALTGSYVLGWGLVLAWYVGSAIVTRRLR